MKINDYKNILKDLVHKELYENSVLNDDDKNNIKAIKKFLNSSNSIADDIRTIVSSKDNENYYAYDKYIISFLKEAKKETKLEILYNQEQYKDLLRNDELYLKLWETLNFNEKLEYIKTKKKFSDIDTLFINNIVKDCSCFSDNSLFNEILNNEDIRKKIKPFSVDLVYSYTLCINLTDYDLCKMITPKAYTKIILKKCKTFKEFKDLYEVEKQIYNLIEINGLAFDSSENEEIYHFLLENPKFIGKFDIKYLDLFSIVEINELVKKKSIDGDSYSSLIQKLYRYNPEDVNKLFSRESLAKCSDNSINVNPFINMDKGAKKEILKNNELLNKFVDIIRVEAMNDCFNESEIVDFLRNDDVVSELSPYALQLLLNKISFKASFNMLQRSVILDKINNLNVKVTEKDAIFFKGYLDSPVLVYKSEHSMLYEMLNMLESIDIMYYITLPYIINKLSNYELVNLINSKKIQVKEVLDSVELCNKFNVVDVINVINTSFEDKVELDIFRDKDLCKILFNINEDLYEKINFDEVNYLFENIRMKSVLSKRESKATVVSYKCVLASYLVLGLDKTLEMVSDGNMNVTLDDVLKLEYDVVNEEILHFKENNSFIFQNMSKKIIHSLEDIGYIEDKNDLALQVRGNTYLDNIIYLMLDNDYDSYNNIIDKLYGYIRLASYDKYAAKKELYDYTNDFVELYLENKLEEFADEFEKNIFQNFKPKDKVLFKKQENAGKEYLDKLKFKLFVKALTDDNKSVYKIYFNDSYDLEHIKEKYLRFLANSQVDFDDLLLHVLIPIANERFDKENCLDKLGIKKPKDTDDYVRYLDSLEIVTRLNEKLKKYKEKYSKEQMLEIMEYICYDYDLDFKVSKSQLNEFTMLGNNCDNVYGEVYIDKENLKFDYKENVDIYDLDEVIEYLEYVDLLDRIVRRTISYINKIMNTENIRNSFNKEYYKVVTDDSFEFPLENRYYELKKHVLSLSDIEKIFNGYDLGTYKQPHESLKKFLFDKKNLIMVVDGYYKNIVENFGVIISNWDDICQYAKQMNINPARMSLIETENILYLFFGNENVFNRSIDNDIMKSIYDEGYYEINDVRKRYNILIKLFKASLKRISSTIPFLSYRNENYKVKILDNYNQDVLRSIDDSLYRVGALGNDFLHYTILDKNGFQLGIYDNNKLVAKVFGVRNGNTIYFNALDGKYNKEYNDLLRLFANELISLTKDTSEPIEFVTIVNSDNYTSRNGFSVDSTICPIINNPIPKKYMDYKNFIEHTGLIDPDNMYTNYEDNISTLLANSKVIDKYNFKFYDAEDKYLRIRNDVIKLSNNIGEEYIRKIDTILYLCKLEDNSISIEDISLGHMEKIYIGDDFVVFLTNKGNILKFVLPYDERADMEVNLIIEAIKKDLN